MKGYSLQGFVKKAGITALCLSIAPTAMASGFRTPFESGAQIGEVYAGGAALAQDASTGFFNAAGLTRIPQQLVTSVIAVVPSIVFTGRASAPNLANNALPAFSQTGVASGGESGLVPAFHYSQPLNEDWAFGFGLTSPFGLVDRYEDDSIVRYTATKSLFTTVNLSPSLAYRVTPKLSLGFGLDAQRAKRNLVLLTNTFITGVSPNSVSEESSGSWGYGAHAGVLYQFNDCTRIGLNFRSQIVQQLKGSSRLTTPTQVVTSNGFKSTLPMPAITTLSGYHAFNDRWSLMGTIDYTNWSAVKSAILQNVASTTALGAATTINQYSPLNYKNTFRYALGTHYDFSQRWGLRAGVAFDQTPTRDTTREIRLMDQNSVAVGVGAHYQLTKTVGLDGSYARAVLKRAVINQTDALSGASTVGTGKISANAFGLQATWTIL